jgi:hypothetical protein
MHIFPLFVGIERINSRLQGLMESTRSLSKMYLDFGGYVVSHGFRQRNYWC